MRVRGLATGYWVRVGRMDGHGDTLSQPPPLDDGDGGDDTPLAQGFSGLTIDPTSLSSLPSGALPSIIDCPRSMGSTPLPESMGSDTICMLPSAGDMSQTSAQLVDSLGSMTMSGLPSLDELPSDEILDGLPPYVSDDDPRILDSLAHVGATLPASKSGVPRPVTAWLAGAMYWAARDTERVQPYTGLSVVPATLEGAPCEFRMHEMGSKKEPTSRQSLLARLMREFLKVCGSSKKFDQAWDSLSRQLRGDGGEESRWWISPDRGGHRDGSHGACIRPRA
eukprot:COSAG01_NODE_4347_length_5116_cov_11.269683_4_plen_280_part_00